MNVGEKLKSLREYYGYSQNDIAKLLNTTQRNVSYYESMTEVTGLLEYVMKLCGIFKMPVKDFFIENISELKKELPDYIEPEQAALLKILNTSVDVKTRIQVLKVFTEVMKTVLLQHESRLKHLPEFRELFKNEYPEPEEEISSGLKVAEEDKKV